MSNREDFIIDLRIDQWKDRLKFTKLFISPFSNKENH